MFKLLRDNLPNTVERACTSDNTDFILERRSDIGQMVEDLSSTISSSRSHIIKVVGKRSLKGKRSEKAASSFLKLQKKSVVFCFSHLEYTAKLGNWSI